MTLLVPSLLALSGASLHRAPLDRAALVVPDHIAFRQTNSGASPPCYRDTEGTSLPL